MGRDNVTGGDFHKKKEDKTNPIKRKRILKKFSQYNQKKYRGIDQKILKGSIGTYRKAEQFYALHYGKKAGHVWIGKTKEKFGAVMYLYVPPEYRNIGIGTKLVEEACKTLSPSECKEVHV